MYWMDAAGLYTVEPPTRKLRKAPEINALMLRPTFVISRSGVRIRPPAPPQSAKREYGGIPEWPKGTDCKSAGNAFGGSNPPSPTRKKRRFSEEARRFFLVIFTFRFSLFSFLSNRRFRRKDKTEERTGNAALRRKAMNNNLLTHPFESRHPYGCLLCLLIRRRACERW